MTEFSAETTDAGANAILTVDLAALVANWRRLRARATDSAGSGECAAVVKADAYGIGLEPVARALCAAGCQSFFVAHVGEGAKLRAAAPQARIFVLNGLPPGAAPLFVRDNLIPVLGSMSEIDEWADFCKAQKTPAPAALHIDTGMNRLGLRRDEIGPANARLGDFQPVLVMSHFIASEELDSSRNRAQIKLFNELRSALPPLPASLCNSSGMFLDAAPSLDLTRPGYALYGGNPTPGKANPMAHVARLEAKILGLRTIEAGESAGYNAIWTASSRRRLATIGVGYADGFPRNATGPGSRKGAQAFVGGVYCPIVGRVSMDLSIVDVTEVKGLKRGDRVELLGPHIGVDDLAASARTIGYEILTNLGRRYKRVYLKA